MKKIALFIATVAAMAGLSACSQDDSPVLQTPTEFKLNTPPFVNQFYQLSPEGELQLTCSQPDYGVGVQTTYGVEISLDENFEKSAVITPKEPFNATITIPEEKVALAICDLLGIVDEDTWVPFANDHTRPLYVRATAIAGYADYSRIVSNVVTLPNVSFYFAIPTPGYIYLVGSPSDWKDPLETNAEHYKAWRLYESEDAIGSKVYSAVFDMPADPVFRFYTALNGWETDFLGCPGGPNEDKEVACTLTDGEYNGTLTETKDKFEFADFAGGKMTITVDLNKMTIKIQAGEVEVHPIKYVYMCGNMASSDWTEPSAANEAFYQNWRLECNDGTNVYKGQFDLKDCGAADLYCRFYQALTGWGKAQWASPTDADYPVTLGQPTPTKDGEGCFQVPGAKGKIISVVLDATANEVTFSFVE